VHPLKVPQPAKAARLTKAVSRASLAKAGNSLNPMATVAVSTVANRVVIGAASAEVAAATADHAETAVAVAVAVVGAVTGGDNPRLK
jgi:hypothetical protein